MEGRPGFICDIHKIFYVYLSYLLFIETIIIYWISAFQY